MLDLSYASSDPLGSLLIEVYSIRNTVGEHILDISMVANKTHACHLPNDHILF